MTREEALQLVDAHLMLGLRLAGRLRYRAALPCGRNDAAPDTVAATMKQMGLDPRAVAAALRNRERLADLVLDGTLIAIDGRLYAAEYLTPPPST